MPHLHHLHHLPENDSDPSPVSTYLWKSQKNSEIPFIFCLVDPTGWLRDTSCNGCQTPDYSILHYYWLQCLFSIGYIIITNCVSMTSTSTTSGKQSWCRHRLHSNTVIPTNTSQSTTMLCIICYISDSQWIENLLAFLILLEKHQLITKTVWNVSYEFTLIFVKSQSVEKNFSKSLRSIKFLYAILSPTHWVFQFKSLTIINLKTGAEAVKKLNSQVWLEFIWLEARKGPESAAHRWWWWCWMLRSRWLSLSLSE